MRFSMKYSKKFLKELNRTMIRIRLCEESLIEPFLMEKWGVRHIFIQENYEAK